MSEPAPPPPGFALHHVQLAIPAGSEDRCRAFYIGTLEMSEVAKPAALAGRGGLWLRSGRLEIHLGVDDDFHPATKAHPGILVDDPDAVATQLEEAGSPVTWDDLFPGHRRFYTTDPVGNRLEFLTAT